MMLSAQATSFQPLTYEPVDLAIYNDGVPSMVFRQGSETELLHGISDEAIDEAFPPTAQDAAEIEDAECFVALMAHFDLMERREEATRMKHTGLNKRWEARRELVGRPKPAMHRVEHVVHAGERQNIPHGEQELVESTLEQVLFDQPHLPLENRFRAREENNRITHSKASKKTASNAYNHKPIVQPRKQN
jgi:hypothetical protein